MITATVFFVALSFLAALVPLLRARTKRKALYFLSFQIVAAFLSVSLVYASAAGFQSRYLQEVCWFLFPIYIGTGFVFVMSLFTEQLRSNLVVWITVAGWFICSLLWPTVVEALINPLQHLYPITTILFSGIIVVVFFISSWILLTHVSTILSLPVVSHGQFMLRSLVKASLCAVIISFFIWLSLPSMATAEALPVVFTFGSAAFSTVTAHTLVNEERLGLMHLFRHSLDGKTLTDKELDVVLVSLRQLRLALEQERILPAQQMLGDTVITVQASETPDLPDINSQEAPPRGWIDGTIHARDVLRREVHRDLAIIQSINQGPVVEEGLVFGEKTLGLAEYQKLIGQNRALNQDRYGCDLIGVSPEFRHNLYQLKQAQGAQPLFINGESGVGKGAFAAQALKKLGCNDIIEFDAKDTFIQSSLIHNIREMKAVPGVKRGLIIANAEHIPSEQWSALCSALDEVCIEQAVAVLGNNLPESIPEQAIAISIPPLRERPRDLFYLAIQFILDAEQELHRGITKVSSSFVNALFQHSWPGNCNELKAVCREAVLRGESETITRLPVVSA